MNKDGLKKEFEYLIMAKNHIWLAALATFGGSFGLMFIQFNLYVKWIIITAGMVLSLIFFDKYFKKDVKIENIIKLLKKGDKYDD